MVVGFLRRPSGRCPIEDFLDGLAPGDARKALWVFRLVERLDRVPASYLKKLKGTADLWEIRIQGSRQTYRVLAFPHAGTLWAMQGYSKKRWRSDGSQIARAEKMRRDFLARLGD